MKAAIYFFATAAISFALLAACTKDSESQSAADTINIPNAAPTTSTPDTNTPKNNTPDSPPAQQQTPQTPTEPLPNQWPTDVKLADYMDCVGVTRVRDDFMVSFHARNTQISQVVEWFKSTMTADGWTTTAENALPANTTLVFNKDSRTCGITITNFILNQSMQRDDSACGITIQTPGQGGP